MNILSITDGYNASASLMIDGKIVLALQEERFNEVKSYMGYPNESVKYCLKYLKENNLTLNRAGMASNHQNPYDQKVKIYQNFKPEDFREWWRTKIQFNYFTDKNGKNIKLIKGKKRNQSTITYLKKIQNKYKNNIEHHNFKFLNNKIINKPHLEIDYYNKVRLKTFSDQISFNEDDIEVIDHHTCHAYYGYFSSALNGKDCLVSTIDGGGDGYKQSLWTVKKNKLKLLSRNNSCPIGKYWKIICVLLSLKPHEHEYKVMGLAPYSKNNYTNEVFKEIKNLCDIKNYDILEKKIPKKFNCLYDFFEKKFSNFRFDAISGGIQKYTEYLIVKYVKLMLKKTKQKNFVGSGGLFMNIKLNKAISEIKNLKDIFISASGGDESLSIGCCYYMNKDKKNYPLENLYLGFKEKNININKISKKNSIKSIKNSNEIVRRLINGEILGMFNDRAEFGARALGNRSILARPDLKGTVKKINEAVKNRDFWMPFAVTILNEHHKNFIINKKSLKSSHMTMGFDTVKSNLKFIVSGTHPYDETVRPQILERDFNPKYYDLINRFYKKTKIPALLNTSLNLHGKPTVNCLDQAIFTLNNSKLDCLVVNYKYLITKN
jgi:carbamoyltransferase